MWSDKPHRAILSQDCQAFFDPHFIMVMTIKCIMLCLLNRSLYLRLAVTLKCGPQYIVATDNISRVSVLNIVNIVVRFGDKSNVHEYSPLRWDGLSTVCILNNKNNNQDNVYGAVMMSSWRSHCDSSPGSFDECRMAPSGRRPKTKPDDLGCVSACTGGQKLHPPSPFIIITQPESWYSFYRHTEGRRLSRPSWLVTYRDGLPVHRRSPILVLTGSDVAQLRWSRPTRYH